MQETLVRIYRKLRWLDDPALFRPWAYRIARLADFSNRTHVLLLLLSVASYTIIAIGLLALGAHVTRNTLRVLRAVQLAADGRS